MRAHMGLFEQYDASLRLDEDERYHEQFHDILDRSIGQPIYWSRGVMALLGVYIFCVFLSHATCFQHSEPCFDLIMKFVVYQCGFVLTAKFVVFQYVLVLIAKFAVFQYVLVLIAKFAVFQYILVLIAKFAVFHYTLVLIAKFAVFHYTLVLIAKFAVFQYGFNLVIAHRHAINCIALSLNHRSLRYMFA